MDLTDIQYYSEQEDFEELEEFLDTSLIEIDEKSLPAFSPDFSSAVVIDNIPVCGQDKVPKLRAMLMKFINQAAPAQDADLYMPSDPSTGMTFGFCFFKFANATEAANAVKLLNGVAFDKKHIFNVTPYASLDVFAKLSEDDTAPAVEHYPMPEVTHWLTDIQARDQFAIRHSGETEIHWASPASEEVKLVYGGEREKLTGKKWCELNVDWSPKGTYFVTFHNPGVKMWGGDDFQAQGRFMHKHVEEISFSPCERYLVTYRNTDDGSGDAAREAIAVWDVRTAEQLKTFSYKNPLDVHHQVKCTVYEEKKSNKKTAEQDDSAAKKVEREVRGRISAITVVEEKNGRKIERETLYTVEEGNVTHVGVPLKCLTPLQEPNRLKWSADGKYLARLAPDVISIYETPSMALLDKKSLAVKEVSDFSWSPRENLLAVLSPAVGNLPASINLLRIPSRESVASRKMFDVAEGKMVWHNDGDFLAVYLTKTTNKKKTYVLMIFRVKEAGIPVEQLDFNEPVLGVSWEPFGERLAVIRGEERNATVDFFSLAAQAAPAKAKGAAAAKTGLAPFFTKTGTPCSSVHWSPMGSIVALVQFASEAVLFDLLDVDNKAVVAAGRRHDRGNKLVWDPSGRFISTCTITELRNAYAKGRVEDGVNFYNVQGTLVHQFKQEKLHSFAWRPRPLDILTREEKKKVVKNLKKYEKEFDKEDKVRREEHKKESLAARFKLAKEFLDWKNKNRALCAQLKPQRVVLRDGYDSDDDSNYDIEITIEEQVLKTTEQIVGKNAN